MNWKKFYEEIKVGDTVRIKKVIGSPHTIDLYSKYIGTIAKVINVYSKNSFQLNIPSNGGGTGTDWSIEEIEKVLG